MKRFSRVLIAVLLASTILALPAWSGGQGEKAASPTAAVVASGQYKEAPMLAERVAKKELPAVKDRLPKEPAVRKTIESIGKYGGTMRVLAANLETYNDMQLAVEGGNLYRIPMAGVGLEPNLAKGYEISTDKKTFTIYLREGTKWSDGAPFTSEDIRFFLLDMQTDPKVRVWGVTRGLSAAEVVNETTIKVTNPNGLGGFIVTAADWDSGWAGIYQPAHYLKKWHLKYNPDAEALAKTEGFASWYDAIKDKYFWSPPVDKITQLPRMLPWVYTQRGTSAVELERNPYYWAVDQAGNQLPYIDKIHATVVDQEVYQLKAVAGETDIAYNFTRLTNVSLYRSNEKAGNYRTILWPSNTGSDFTIELNLFNPDPISHEYQSDLRFRQALSLALDREEMNKILFFGLGVPRQVAPLDNVSYNKNWGQYYAKYDAAQANKLLDEIGLNKKDSDGYRLRKDGKPVQMIIEYGDPTLSTGFELIKEYWDAVGVKTIIKLEDWGLIEQRMFASEHDAVQDGFNQGGDERTLYGMAWHWDTAATRKWETWASSMQTAWRAEVGTGNPIPTDYLRRMPKDISTITGEKPSNTYIEYIEARNKISSLDLGTAEYAATGQKIFDTYVTQLWNIGTVGMAPTPLIVKNNIGNVPDPKNYIKGQRLSDALVAHFADQLYFK